MLSARVKVLFLSYQLLSFYVSRTRQHEADNTVFMYCDTATIPMQVDSTAVSTIPMQVDSTAVSTIPMQVDSTAVYIMSSSLSQSMTSSPSAVVTSELSPFSISSLHTMKVTVPLVTSTTSAMLTSVSTAVVVPSVEAGTTEGSSDNGGVIAAIVVSVLVLVGAATAIVIILVVCMQRKKKTKRRYSFTKSTETVYLNVSTTIPVQEPPCVENGDENKEGTQGSTLNQPTTTSTSDQDSSYHIYEMAEITDDVVGKPEEEIQEVSNMPDVRPDTAVSRLKRAAYSWGSRSQKQKKNLKDPQRVPPRRYNTMSEYEFMRPQLQAAAARAAKNRRRIPSDEDEDGENLYSEIGEARKSQRSGSQQSDQSDKQSDNYIFMRTGRPSAQFSSFLSKWLDNINKDDTSSANVNPRNQSGEGQSLSQVNEEDVYITMD